MVSLIAQLAEEPSPSNQAINKHVNEDFLATISTVPGFVSYHGIDSGKDDWASLSVFETAEGAAEANRRAADFVDKLKPLIASGPAVLVGDLAASCRR